MGKGLPVRTPSEVPGGVIMQAQNASDIPVEIEQLAAGRHAPLAHKLRREPLASGDKVTDGAKSAQPLARFGEEPPVKRRHAEHYPRAMALDDADDGIGVGPVGAQNRAHAVRERREQAVLEPVGEEELGGREHVLALANAEGTERLAQRHCDAMLVDDGFGPACGARGVQTERGCFGLRFERHRRLRRRQADPYVAEHPAGGGEGRLDNREASAAVGGEIRRVPHDNKHRLSGLDAERAQRPGRARDAHGELLPGYLLIAANEGDAFGMAIAEHMLGKIHPA
jgi:hypothetical protein